MNALLVTERVDDATLILAGVLLHAHFTDRQSVLTVHAVVRGVRMAGPDAEVGAFVAEEDVEGGDFARREVGVRRPADAMWRRGEVVAADRHRSRRYSRQMLYTFGVRGRPQHDCYMQQTNSQMTDIQRLTRWNKKPNCR